MNKFSSVHHELQIHIFHQRHVTYRPAGSRGDKTERNSVIKLCWYDAFYRSHKKIISALKRTFLALLFITGNHIHKMYR